MYQLSKKGVFCVRVRAKTVTKTISKTVPPAQSMESSTVRLKASSPRPPEALLADGEGLPADVREAVDQAEEVPACPCEEAADAAREGIDGDMPFEEQAELAWGEQPVTALEPLVAQETMPEECEERMPPVSDEAPFEEQAELPREEQPVTVLEPLLSAEPQLFSEPLFLTEPLVLVEGVPDEPVSEAPPPARLIEEIPPVEWNPSPPLIPPTPPIPPEQTVRTACPGRPYTVRRGDSYQLIARKFGVSVRALLEANPELQPSRLMVGDVLCVPLAEPPEPMSAPIPAPAPAPRQDKHRVREGESIADILLAGDVSLNAFQAANPGLRLGHQRVGDVLRMPPPGTRGRCGEGTPYAVNEGEDISAFAARQGVTVGALLRANPHLLPSDFRPGQVVCVLIR